MDSGDRAASQASSVKSKVSVSSAGSGAVGAGSERSKESHGSYSFFSPQQFGRTSLEVLAHYKDIWMLGVTMVIGGQYFHWNEGMAAGFGNFFIASVITAIGYICLCFCIAEMTSILPFSGGAYGFSRVTVSIFGGYIVGCCEAMEYVLYVTASMFVLGKMTSFFLGLPNTYEPLFWLLFYILAIGIQLQGGRVFWRTNAILSVVSVLVICMYCLACIPLMDFNDNASLGGDGSHDPWFGGRDGFSFMHVLPLASWFFVGIEAVPLAGQETHEPKVAMPKGIILCVLTMTLTSLAVVCCTAAVGPSPGDIADTLSPLAHGFSTAFGIAERYVYILVVPAMFATCYGFLFACGRQVCAMAESGLFPNFLRATVPSRGTPYMALVVSSLIGYGFLLITWQHPWLEVVLFHICITGSYVTYLASFCSFISFRLFYPGLDKKYTYRSPFGLAGACLGILIFTLCIISVAAFQKDEGLSIFFFVGFILVCSAFYLLYARHNQRFSPMEKSVMMIAHVLKADRIKKKTRPGRLPSKEESEGIISQLRDIFKNRWRRDSSESGGKMSGHKRPSSEVNVGLDSIVAANVSVNESEPFYDQDRVSARELSNSRCRWSSLREALAGMTVAGGPAVSPAGSDVSGSAGCSIAGIELRVPGSPAMSAQTREDGTEPPERRDSISGAMWAAIRDTLGHSLPAAVTTSPASTVPGSTQHLSPASSVASLDVEMSAALALPAAVSVHVFEEPPTGGTLPPKNASSARPSNLWGSIRGALGGNTAQSKHYVTPNLSREASELVLDDEEAGHVNSLPSSVGIGSPYVPTPSPEIEYIRARGPAAPTPMDSYDNSARISVCSVEDDGHGDIRDTPSAMGGEATPRSMFGAHILSSLMAIAAGGSSAAGSHDTSALSSKCPSIGSAEQREFDVAALAHDMLTPRSDLSEETKRAHVAALHSFGGSARSLGSSGSMWTALRESLSKTLNYTPRQSAAPSLDTSAQSSKYTSMREEMFPSADLELDAAGRPLVRTESLDYSGDRAAPALATAI